MPRYKRTRDEAQLDLVEEPIVDSQFQDALVELRNTWEFASVMQYINLFGTALKIDDDFDVEDLEAECLRNPPSNRLPEIGLTLLKHVSSHRGLTLDIFAEYTRRQYLAKAPQRNPFGDKEQPTDFNDLNVHTRLQVLHQLSNWTIGNPERFRALMPEEEDQVTWRVDPIGWDQEERIYYVLDDNRLYRRTDPALPTIPVKPKSKKRTPRRSGARATRANKRRKVNRSVDEDGSSSEVELSDAEEPLDLEVGRGDGLGFTSQSWECVAVSLADYQNYIASIFRSRDPNEKQLRLTLETDVLPIIEKRAESMRQKQLKRLRELENVQRMSTAKRSSRLADKADKEKQERDEREAEEKRMRELKMAHEEQERQQRIKEGYESRRLTREQRVRERETKRILHEEELGKLEEARAAEGDVEADGHTKRMSERQLQSQSEKHKQELEKLAEEDGMWIFDCAVCGLHGENLDDGTHSIACDLCNVWQHSKCHGFTPKQAERDDFHFICATCLDKPVKQEVNQEVDQEVSQQVHQAAAATEPAPLPRSSLPHSETTSLLPSSDSAVRLSELRTPHLPHPASPPHPATAASLANGVDPSDHRSRHQAAHDDALFSSGAHLLAPTSITHEINGRSTSSQHTPPKLNQSPKTTFPLPARGPSQHAGYSPVKSSPPPHGPQRDAYVKPSPEHGTPRLALSPPHLALGSVKSQRADIESPQQVSHLRPLSSASSNGMSGPWPEGSTSIPVKSSQSPVPFPHGNLNGAKILPPTAGFAPLARPAGQEDHAITIPIKKVQDQQT